MIKASTKSISSISEHVEVVGDGVGRLSNGGVSRGTVSGIGARGQTKDRSRGNKGRDLNLRKGR